MSRFFIARPIFAWVIAICITLGGVLAIQSLPVEQYPDIAPPSLSISLTYPGSDAETLEKSATQIIEQELNGIDGLLYMDSASRSNGTATITATFVSGTDIDIAQTDVQNRIASIEARLPAAVRSQGVEVSQTNGGFLMIVALTSADDRFTPVDLGNVAATRIVDELRRVPGVGSVTLFGSEYAMRIWLDPQRLASFGLSPYAVLAAIGEQNAQTPGGALGDLPNLNGTQINATIVTQNRFSTIAEFEEIILRANTDGATVRLKDVARVEIGAENYRTEALLNGKPMAAMAIQLVAGGNALDTAAAVEARMAELESSLPDGVTWSVPYDTTPFVQVSIDSVISTLIEAFILVFLVMYLFLQNLRATLIPALIVPATLAGAFLGLWLFGFSINVLTLFAMVLAIGILVDDAIIVIENVERIMREEGLSPVEATRKAMGQITGAIIGTSMVIAVVFIPMAFFPGSTGGIYRQFSVTMVAAIGFSTVLALIFTPALCATILKQEHSAEAGPEGAASEPSQRLTLPRWLSLPLNRASRLLGGFLRGFEAWFGRMTNRYLRANDRILARPGRWFAVYLLIASLAALLFFRLPGGFLPTEDQGYLITAVQTPPGSTRERMDAALEPLTAYWVEREETSNVVLIKGFSFFGQGQNNAIMFSTLTPWDVRSDANRGAAAIAGDAQSQFFQRDDSFAFVIQPPSIQSLGNASGFTLKLQDRRGLGREALTAARDQMLGAAMQSNVIGNLRPEDQPPAPQLRVDIDRVLARALGLPIGDVNSALSVNFGSAYVNDFNREGRSLQVYVQADAPYRMTPDDLMALRIPNAAGELVPFSSFATARWTAGPPSVGRYNGYPAMTLSGEAAPGFSSGEAIAEMERLAEQLPEGIGYAWTGLSYEETQAAGQIGLLLGLSGLIVFLVLAALYESWSTPVTVMLIIPLGVLGAVGFSLLRGLTADIYFIVGLITIIGLAAKNAILVVEFAVEQEEEGKTPYEAVREAARLRLRPIIMTSLAFAAAMVPLAIATGAGAESRIAVGFGVLGGMISATVFGVFTTPMLYLLVRRYLAGRRESVPEIAEENLA